MFAKNLNDFDIQLFGQTVHYSLSPSSNVPFDPLGCEEPTQLHVVPHFRHISVFHKGPYIKYVGGGPEAFCGGHEIF